MNNVQIFDLKTKLLNVLQSALGDGANLPGEVFSSGLDTLRDGPLYVLGLNPGGGSSYLSVGEHVRTWNLTKYSAFYDQCWNRDCWDRDSYGRQNTLTCNCERGKDKHQKAVIDTVRCMLPGVNLRTVFATNAIFMASRDADSFQNETKLSLQEAWNVCWKVHQFLLGVVRPKVILCLGYGEDESAFSFLRSKCSQLPVTKGYPKELRQKEFKWFEENMPIDEDPIRPLVIGVFHPSRGGYRIRDENALRAIVERKTCAS